MPEYIKKDDVLAFPIRADHCDKKHANDHFINGIETVMEYIEYMPAADVAPVVHGKWIPVEAYGIGNTAKCSECEKRQYGYDGFKFCPNCGAKMDGDIK